MSFNQTEKDALLAIKGVGPTVVRRLEEIGIQSFAELRQYEADDIVEMVASMLNASCWKNSPNAKAAIQAAIERAKQ